MSQSENENSIMKPQVPTQWGDEKRGFHIDKTISISDLLTVFSLACGLIWYGSQFQSRLDMQQEALRRTDATIAAEKQFRDAQRAEDQAAARGVMVDLQQQIRSMDARMTDRLEKIADKVGAPK